MAGKFVDVTLRLIDKMTSPLNSAGQALARHATQIKRAGKEIQSVGKSISNVGSNLTKSVTAPILAAGTASFKLASDMNESLSKTEVTFKKNATEIKKWSETTLEQFGISKGAALEYASKYGDMATGMGMSTKEAAKLSKNITGLVGDLASFKNISQDTADTALTAIFTGETESLKQLGIVMTQTNLQEYARSQSIKKNIKDMTQQEQVMLRYNYVMAMTKNAQGDFNRTSDQSANQMRIAQESIKQFGASIGSIFLPHVTKMIQKVNQLLSKLNNLSDSKKKTIVTIAGIAAAIGPVIMTFGKLVTSVGSAISVIGKIGMMFKNFGTISAMLASPAGIVVAVLAAIAVAAVLVYKNWDKIKPVIDKVVKSLQPAIKIFKDMLSACKETLAPIGSLFKKSFGSAIAESTGIVSKEFGSTSDIIKSFGQTCTKIMSTIAPIVKKAVEMIAEVLKKVIPVVASQIPKAVSIVSKVIKSVIKVIEKIAPVVKTVLSTIAKAMPMMQKRVSSTFNAILPIIKIAAKLLLKIGTVIGSVISKAVQAAMPVIQKFGTCFKTVFPVVAKIVIEKVGNITGIITKMQPVFEFVFSVAGKYVSALGERISGVFGGIMTTLGGVLDFITGVFTGNWKKAWEGVKNAFSGVFQSFAAIIKAPMNAVISLINKAISGINGISVDIPEGIPGVGGKHIGFSIPTIPALAKGTSNWKGGIAQVSEKGGEIIDLPKGTRVYPHDKSVQKAYKDGAKAGGGGVKIIIPKLADSIIVREEADIDKIVSKFADKLEKVSSNLGGGEIEYIY